MTFREKNVPVYMVNSSNSNAKNPGNSKKIVWEYAKSTEAKDHIVIKDRYDLFINGKWQKAKKYFATINPATEDIISEVASASNDDVNKSVLAAEKAYKNVWSKTPPKERAKYIFRIARIMQEKAREVCSH